MGEHWLALACLPSDSSFQFPVWLPASCTLYALHPPGLTAAVLLRDVWHVRRRKGRGNGPTAVYAPNLRIQLLDNIVEEGNQ
eukprot:COSAG01_NODE_218_length_21548_cov_7.916919_8_plen_82_part_00